MTAAGLRSGDLSARRIDADALPEAIARLARRPRENLMLLDLAARLGEPPPPGEMGTELVGAWRGGELAGVAALRPTIVFDSEMDADALDALLPFVDELPVGLVKSDPERVGRMWARLARRRRRVWLDRLETALAIEPAGARLVDGAGSRARRAGRRDLEALVFAARESLREEGRPDPFAGDSAGFRRWVEGRLPRALLVEGGGRVCFVGYADVQRADGWLLQGVYTWPQARRLGHGSAGTSALCREAFSAGSDHVQLAVVDGNDAAHRLYRGLGFEPFGRLRTILFT